MLKRICSDSKKLFMIISVFLVVVSTLSFSYAIFTSLGESEKYNSLAVGTLAISYVDTGEGYGDTLSLADQFPISDSDGKKTTPYRFSIENTGTLPLMYTIRIKDDEAVIKSDGCQKKQLAKNFIKIQFDNEEPILLSSKKESDYLFYTGALVKGDSDIHEVRVWLDESSDNTVLDKHFHGKVIIEAIQGESVLSNKVFSDIGSNCQTYDDGIDTYLVGTCSKNYISFADSIWRVVSKNNKTNTVKIISDDSVTNMSFNSNDNTDYQDSSVAIWLNSDYYETIKDYSDFIVSNSTWNIGPVDTLPPTKELVTGSTLVSKVGLLDSYEYYIVDSKAVSDMGLTSNYLINTNSWWLSTYKSGTYLYYVDNTGNINFNTSTYQYGVRPVVNLKANVKVSFSEYADGTLEKPYKLIFPSK